MRCVAATVNYLALFLNFLYVSKYLFMILFINVIFFQDFSDYDDEVAAYLEGLAHLYQKDKNLLDWHYKLPHNTSLKVCIIC